MYFHCVISFSDNMAFLDWNGAWFLYQFPKSNQFRETWKFQALLVIWYKVSPLLSKRTSCEKWMGKERCERFYIAIFISYLYSGFFQLTMSLMNIQPDIDIYGIYYQWFWTEILQRWVEWHIVDFEQFLLLPSALINILRVSNQIRNYQKHYFRCTELCSVGCGGVPQYSMLDHCAVRPKYYTTRRIWIKLSHRCTNDCSYNQNKTTQNWHC